MEDNNDFDFGALVTWVVENGVFALGAILMFTKTVDLMSAFAPSNFMGYTDIGNIYGMAVGVMIEGAFIAMKFQLGRPRNVLEWIWNVILIIAPFSISALAQVFDSFILRDTLSTQPQEVQLFVTWFVPSIPTVIVSLFIGKAIFGSIPPQMLRGFKKSQVVEVEKPVTKMQAKKPTIKKSGFKNWVERMMPAPQMNTNAFEAKIAELEARLQVANSAKNPVENERKEPNPTAGQEKRN